MCACACVRTCKERVDQTRDNNVSVEMRLPPRFFVPLYISTFAHCKYLCSLVNLHVRTGVRLCHISFAPSHAAGALQRLYVCKCVHLFIVTFAHVFTYSHARAGMDTRYHQNKRIRKGCKYFMGHALSRSQKLSENRRIGQKRILRKCVV